MDLSFHVRLIGTFSPDLVCAPAEAIASEWLAENSPDFDQFPVRRGDNTIGILCREGDHGDSLVSEVMQPLSDGLIVSADMALGELIPHLRESHYQLVVRGGRIDGLVTQSDLLKLPVRMFLFGNISHLEVCLRALVRQVAPWPTWIELLSAPRRRRLSSQYSMLQSSNMEPDSLELTNFGDVVRVLSQIPELGSEFSEQAESIRQLRNDIAHAKTFISSEADVREFVQRFIRTRDLIDRVSRLLKAAK